MNITLPIQDEIENLWSDWFSEQRFFLWLLLDLINENKSKKSWQCWCSIVCQWGISKLQEELLVKMVVQQCF